MSNELVIRKALSAKVKAKLRKLGCRFRPGDVIVGVRSNYRQGAVFRVLRMTEKRIVVAEWDDGQWCDRESCGDLITIGYDHINDYIKYDGDPVTLESDVLAMMQDVEGSLGSGPDLVPTDETALAPCQGKEPLLAAEATLQAAQNRALIARAIMQRKADEIGAIVHRFQEGLEKVRKVLHVAELYLGIDEEVLLIRDGEPAAATEPLSIRQMILYMDEEFGDPAGGGLDWKGIDQFDEWVVRPENTARVLPEAKGAVALQVRRHLKQYEDIWAQVEGDAKNSRTYLLIRNGQRLYRIWMKEHIHPRLFPRKDEFKPKPRHIRWSEGTEEEYWSPFDERDLKEREFAYKKHGVMLQGLLHRTQVFQPMAESVDLFEPKSWKGLVRFIRDDELTLPTGRLPWRDWQRQINSATRVGSRIIWMDKIGYYKRDDEIHFRTGYTAGYGVPAPKEGLYVVVAGSQGEQDRKHLRFFYNPGDVVWRRADRWTGRCLDDGPRKRRIGFHFDDDEVLNYDQIDLADIEFYIHCRTERKHYADMLPLLYELRKQRLAEIEHEKGLVRLLTDRLQAPEPVIWKTIEWWKTKNKWKRPVAQDDAKALRMIRGRIKRQLKGNA